MLVDRLRITDVGSIGANGGPALDLTLGRGATVLVGPNGSGKSTVLVALAAGVDPGGRWFDAVRHTPWHNPEAHPMVAVTWVPDDAGVRNGPRRPATATTTVVEPGGVPEGTPVEGNAGRPQLVFVPAEDQRRDTIVRHLGAVCDVDAEMHSLSTPQLLRRLVVELAVAARLSGDSGLVVAIDQPETGLHPAAQRQLAGDLDRLATTAGVTVVIATHSPFVVPRTAATEVVALVLDDGATVCTGSSGGNQPLAGLMDGMLDDRGVADILDVVATIAPTAAGIVVVEGDTDAAYLELAATLNNRPDLLSDLHVAVAHGTRRLVLDALVMRSIAGNRPVLVLVDHDDEGRQAAHVLTGRLGLRNRTEVMSVAEVFDDRWRGHPWDAEDLLPSALLERFVDEHGEADILRGKYRRPDDQWHWDLTTEAKSRLPGWLQSKATGEDLRLWLELLVMARTRMGLTPPGHRGPQSLPSSPADTGRTQPGSPPA